MQAIRELMQLNLDSLSNLLNGNFNGIGLANDDAVKAQAALRTLSKIINSAELTVIKQAKVLEITHHVRGVETVETRKLPEFRQFLGCLQPGPR